MISPTGASWTRLRDIHRAIHNDDCLSHAELQDLATILSHLPPHWQRTLQDDPPQYPWHVYNIGATVLLEGPDLHSPSLTLYEPTQTGRLVRTTMTLPPIQGRPAYVYKMPKPSHSWDMEDRRHHTSDPTFCPSSFIFIGAWEDLEVDPSVWGLGTSSLLSLQVSTARRHLSLKYPHMPRPPPELLQHGALWPPAWSLTPQDGLLHTEARWADSINPAPQTQQTTPLWMQPSQPRISVYDRLQDRASSTPTTIPSTRTDYKLVWRRLLDPTLHRPHRITCWKLLHLSLGCNAFLSHVRRGGQATCSAPDCNAAGRLETLSHALLDCPEVLPVWDWACEVWRRLAGDDLAVPRTAAFILADDPAGWAGEHQLGIYKQWTRFRVAILGSIWQTRCSRGNSSWDQSFARRAAELATNTLRGAIRRDWQRTISDPREQDLGSHFCNDWWRGLDATLTTEAFAQQWTSPPVFCDLRGQLPHQSLDLKLDALTPIALPL